MLIYVISMHYTLLNYCNLFPCSTEFHWKEFKFVLSKHCERKSQTTKGIEGFDLNAIIHIVVFPIEMEQR